MNQTVERTGPKRYRFLVMGLNILLAILVYWLLGFFMDDINSQRGPSLYSIQQQFQDPALINERQSLNNQLTKLAQDIYAQQKQQEILQASINGYRDTMNQLLDLQKASVQKGIAFTQDAQQNLTNATKLYLDNQQQFQNLNQSIANANLETQQLQKKFDLVDSQLNQQSKKGTELYDKLEVKHNLKIAAFKLLILIPLLILTVYLFRKYRQTIYISMISAIAIAIIIKIIEVMHEHFPSREFKYILILALIYLVTRTLLNMLRMTIAPKLNWLIKQYREAYQKLQCPMCQYPIQPGALKFTPAQHKTSNPVDMSYLEQIGTYICPSCGVQLFEKCTACSKIRHSLLMYCEYCGTEKKLTSS